MKIERAIEILDPEHRENYDGMDEVNEACRMGMEALERTRWIPCSERLPETDGPYLVVNKATGWIRGLQFLQGEKLPVLWPPGKRLVEVGQRLASPILQRHPLDAAP